MYFIIDKSTRLNLKLIAKFFAIKFVKLLKALNNAKI